MSYKNRVLLGITAPAMLSVYPWQRIIVFTNYYPKRLYFRVRVQMYKLSLGLRGKRNFVSSALPRGGGTGTNGQSLTEGIVVDMSRYMNRILEINPEQGWVKVEAGVIKDQLNQYLKPYGYFFRRSYLPATEQH